VTSHYSSYSAKAVGSGSPRITAGDSGVAAGGAESIDVEAFMQNFVICRLQGRTALLCLMQYDEAIKCMAKNKTTELNHVSNQPLRCLRFIDESD
jgi:hypothetical protein